MILESALHPVEGVLVGRVIFQLINFLSVDEMMISLLDSGNHGIVYTACGVLINLMVDGEKRGVLKDEGGIKKYVCVKSIPYFV